MDNVQQEDGKCWRWKYSKYITRNGKRIYHPKGGVFRYKVPC